MTDLINVASSDASSSDFDDNDFLELGDEYGTIVDCDPVAGQMGFADFSFDGFLDYSRRLVVLARTNQPAESTPDIQNDLEFNVARACLAALASELDIRYSGSQWEPRDQYVLSYVELMTAIRQYEQRNMNAKLLREEESIREALALSPDSEGGETE